MSELVEFLLARIAEDEARVTLVEGKPPKWSMTVYPHDGEPIPIEVCALTPARVLAECEAKRQIIELHKAEDRSGGWGAPPVWKCAVCGGRTAHPNLGWQPWSETYPCRTLRLLALPYADHPDFRPEWQA